nr:hypothetical protein [Streptomyces blattellae]
MIKKVSHDVAGTDPAGFALALEVAYALHAPAPRAPEVAVSGDRTPRRTKSSSRPRRRTVQG